MALDIDLSPIDNRIAGKLLIANSLVLLAVLIVFCVAVYTTSIIQASLQLKDSLALFSGSLVSSIDPGEQEPDLVSSTRSDPTTIPLSGNES